MTFQKLTAKTLRKHKGLSFTGIVTTFYCHDGNGNFLLQKRSKNTRDEQGKWDFGGGGLKHGYNLIDNVKREIKEEYGVDTLKIDFIGYFEEFRPTKYNKTNSHWLAMIFCVLVDKNKVKINEPDKIDELDWFKLNNLPSPLHSQIQSELDKFGSKILKTSKNQF
ncbi:NUDIX domain-containing protein [Candidatus Saccharibacteria bacterium]|nr:NUDIX domain-containing protein [Candidatus Saccharibacteria bacterium]